MKVAKDPTKQRIGEPSFEHNSLQNLHLVRNFLFQSIMLWVILSNKLAWWTVLCNSLVRLPRNPRKRMTHSATEVSPYWELMSLAMMTMLVTVLNTNGRLSLLPRFDRARWILGGWPLCLLSSSSTDHAVFLVNKVEQWHWLPNKFLWDVIVWKLLIACTYFAW